MNWFTGAALAGVTCRAVPRRQSSRPMLCWTQLILAVQLSSAPQRVARHVATCDVREKIKSFIRTNRQKIMVREEIVFISVRGTNFVRLKHIDKYQTVEEILAN